MPSRGRFCFGNGISCTRLAAGGSAEQAGYAIAIVLQNMLGLICDPVAGLVEIPCVHRNAMGRHKQ